MRAMLLANACAAVLAAAASGTARAEVNYPYCAVASGGYGGAFENCGFVSLEQCRQTVSGGGGWCQANPRYAPSYASPDGQPRRVRPRPGS